MSIYAVIVTGGKQFRVQEKQSLRVDKLDIKPGDSIQFDQVLLIGDGKDTQIGTPYLSGAKVTATVKSHGRGEKIKVIKFKRRKGYMRTQGHRQDYTELEITQIGA